MGILEEFSKRKRQAIPYKGFGSPADLEHSLRSQKYVLMTAQNPAVQPSKGPFKEPIPEGEPPTSENNIEAIKMLMHDLDERDLFYTVQTGHWQAPEFSLIIWSPDKDEDDFFMDMQDLAEDYGQQALMAVEPEAKTLIFPRKSDEEAARDQDEDLNKPPVPKTFEQMTVFKKDELKPDQVGYTSTPFGPSIGGMTGQLSPEVRFEGDKPHPAGAAEGYLYWQFEAKDFNSLTPEQQALVKHRMEVKDKARDPQRKQRRSDR